MNDACQSLVNAFSNAVSAQYDEKQIQLYQRLKPQCLDALTTSILDRVDDNPNPTYHMWLVTFLYARRQYVIDFPLNLFPLTEQCKAEIIRFEKAEQSDGRMIQQQQNLKSIKSGLIASLSQIIFANETLTPIQRFKALEYAINQNMISSSPYIPPFDEVFNVMSWACLNIMNEQDVQKAVNPIAEKANTEFSGILRKDLSDELWVLFMDTFVNCVLKQSKYRAAAKTGKVSETIPENEYQFCVARFRSILNKLIKSDELKRLMYARMESKDILKAELDPIPQRRDFQSVSKQLFLLRDKVFNGLRQHWVHRNQEKFIGLVAKLWNSQEVSLDPSYYIQQDPEGRIPGWWEKKLANLNRQITGWVGNNRWPKSTLIQQVETKLKDANDASEVIRTYLNFIDVIHTGLNQTYDSSGNLFPKRVFEETIKQIKEMSARSSFRRSNLQEPENPVRAVPNFPNTFPVLKVETKYVESPDTALAPPTPTRPPRASSDQSPGTARRMLPEPSTPPRSSKATSGSMDLQVQLEAIKKQNAELVSQQQIINQKLEQTNQEAAMTIQKLLSEVQDKKQLEQQLLSVQQQLDISYANLNEQREQQMQQWLQMIENIQNITDRQKSIETSEDVTSLFQQMKHELDLAQKNIKSLSQQKVELQTQFDEYEQQSENLVQSFRKEIEQLHKTNELTQFALKTKAQALERQEKHLHELGQQVQDMEDLKRRLETLQTEYSQLRKQLTEDFTQQINQFREEYEKKQREMESLALTNEWLYKNQNMALQTKMIFLTATLTQVLHQNAQYRKELDLQSKKINHFQSQITQLKLDIQTSRTEKEALQKQLEHAHKLTESHTSDQKILQDALDTISSLQAQITENEHLQIRLDEALSKLNDQQQQLQQQQSEMFVLRNDKDEQKVRELQIKLQTTEQLLLSMTNDRDKWMKKFLSEDQDVSSIYLGAYELPDTSNHLSKLAVENQINIMLTNAFHRITESDQKSKNLSEQIARLEDYNTRLETSVKELREELIKQQKNDEERSEELTHLQKRLSKTKAELDKAVQDKIDTYGSVRLIKTSPESSLQLKNQLDIAQLEIAKTKSYCRSIENQLQQLTTDQQEAQRLITDLTNQVQELQNQPPIVQIGESLDQIIHHESHDNTILENMPVLCSLDVWHAWAQDKADKFEPLFGTSIDSFYRNFIGKLYQSVKQSMDDTSDSSVNQAAQSLLKTQVYSQVTPIGQKLIALAICDSVQFAFLYKRLKYLIMKQVSSKYSFLAPLSHSYTSVKSKIRNLVALSYQNQNILNLFEQLIGKMLPIDVATETQLTKELLGQEFCGQRAWVNYSQIFLPNGWDSLITRTIDIYQKSLGYACGPLHTAHQQKRNLLYGEISEQIRKFNSLMKQTNRKELKDALISFTQWTFKTHFNRRPGSESVSYNTLWDNDFANCSEDKEAFQEQDAYESFQTYIFLQELRTYHYTRMKVVLDIFNHKITEEQQRPNDNLKQSVFCQVRNRLILFLFVSYAPPHDITRIISIEEVIRTYMTNLNISDVTWLAEVMTDMNNILTQPGLDARSLTQTLIPRLASCKTSEELKNVGEELQNQFTERVQVLQNFDDKWSINCGQNDQSISFKADLMKMINEQSALFNARFIRKELLRDGSIPDVLSSSKEITDWERKMILEKSATFERLFGLQVSEYVKHTKNLKAQIRQAFERLKTEATLVFEPYPTDMSNRLQKRNYELVNLLMSLCKQVLAEFQIRLMKTYSLEKHSVLSKFISDYIPRFVQLYASKRKYWPHLFEKHLFTSKTYILFCENIPNTVETLMAKARSLTTNQRYIRIDMKLNGILNAICQKTSDIVKSVLTHADKSVMVSSNEKYKKGVEVVLGLSDVNYDSLFIFDGPKSNNGFFALTQQELELYQADHLIAFLLNVLQGRHRSDKYTDQFCQDLSTKLRDLFPVNSPPSDSLDNWVQISFQCFKHIKPHPVCLKQLGDLLLQLQNSTFVASQVPMLTTTSPWPPIVALMHYINLKLKIRLHQTTHTQINEAITWFDTKKEAKECTPEKINERLTKFVKGNLQSVPDESKIAAVLYNMKNIAKTTYQNCKNLDFLKEFDHIWETYIWLIDNWIHKQDAQLTNASEADKKYYAFTSVLVDRLIQVGYFQALVNNADFVIAVNKKLSVLNKSWFGGITVTQVDIGNFLSRMKSELKPRFHGRIIAALSQLTDLMQNVKSTDEECEKLLSKVNLAAQGDNFTETVSSIYRTTSDPDCSKQILQLWRTIMIDKFRKSSSPQWSPFVYMIVDDLRKITSADENDSAFIAEFVDTKGALASLVQDKKSLSKVFKAAVLHRPRQVNRKWRQAVTCAGKQVLMSMLQGNSSVKWEDVKMDNEYVSEADLQWEAAFKIKVNEFIAKHQPVSESIEKFRRDIKSGQSVKSLYEQILREMEIYFSEIGAILLEFGGSRCTLDSDVKYHIISQLSSIQTEALSQNASDEKELELAEDSIDCDALFAAYQSKMDQSHKIPDIFNQSTFPQVVQIILGAADNEPNKCNLLQRWKDAKIAQAIKHYESSPATEFQSPSILGNIEEYLAFRQHVPSNAAVQFMNVRYAVSILKRFGPNEDVLCYDEAMSVFQRLAIHHNRTRALVQNECFFRILEVIEQDCRLTDNSINDECKEYIGQLLFMYKSVLLVEMVEKFRHKYGANDLIIPDLLGKGKDSVISAVIAFLGETLKRWKQMLVDESQTQFEEDVNAFVQEQQRRALQNLIEASGDNKIQNCIRREVTRKTKFRDGFEIAKKCAGEFKSETESVFPLVIDRFMFLFHNDTILSDFEHKTLEGLFDEYVQLIDLVPIWYDQHKIKKPTQLTIARFLTHKYLECMVRLLNIDKKECMNIFLTTILSHWEKHLNLARKVKNNTQSLLSLFSDIQYLSTPPPDQDLQLDLDNCREAQFAFFDSLFLQVLKILLLKVTDIDAKNFAGNWGEVYLAWQSTLPPEMFESVEQFVVKHGGKKVSKKSRLRTGGNSATKKPLSDSRGGSDTRSPDNPLSGSGGNSATKKPLSGSRGDSYNGSPDNPLSGSGGDSYNGFPDNPLSSRASGKPLSVPGGDFSESKSPDEPVPGDEYLQKSINTAWKSTKECKAIFDEFSKVLQGIQARTKPYMEKKEFTFRECWTRVWTDYLRTGYLTEVPEGLAEDLQQHCDKHLETEIQYKMFRWVMNEYMLMYETVPLPDFHGVSDANQLKQVLKSIHSTIDNSPAHPLFIQRLQQFIARKHKQFLNGRLEPILTQGSIPLNTQKGTLQCKPSLQQVTSWEGGTHRYLIDQKDFSNRSINESDVLPSITSSELRIPHIVSSEITYTTLAPIATTLSVRHLDPLYEKTFWEYIPNEVRFSNESWLYRMQQYLMKRYTHTICSDVYSKNRIAWFLTLWCQSHRTKDAFLSWEHHKDFKHDPWCIVWRHALTILDDIFMVQNSSSLPLDVHCGFHPFIRGFLDMGTRSNSWSISQFKTTSNSDLSSKSYLQCNDTDDELFTMLSAHPNQFLIRLSPTHPLHLEFICQSVDSKQALPDHIVFYRIDMLRDKSAPPGCELSMLYMLYNMKHISLLCNDSVLGSPFPIPIHIFPLVTFLMKRKAQKEHAAYFAPVMTNRGSFLASLKHTCKEVTKQTLDFSDLRYISLLYSEQLWDDIRLSINPLGVLINVHLVSQVEFLKPYQEIVNTYDKFIQADEQCADLFPTFDSFADAGCSNDPKWMISQPVTLTNNNFILTECYRHVYETFYLSSPWVCGKNPRRDRDIWHLVRWLGISYWKHFQDNPRPEWCLTIGRVLLWIMHSGEAYPFLNDEESKSMMSFVNSELTPKAAVLRLSTKTPLALDIGGPEEINLKQWIQANFFAVNFTDNILDQDIKREIEFVLRSRIFEKYQKVLLRSPSYIEQHLESCGFSVQKFSTRWQERTSSEALKDCTRYVKDTKNTQQQEEWARMRSLTIQINAESELSVNMKSDFMCANGNPRIDFDWFKPQRNINFIVCEPGPNWIFAQPLMSLEFLTQSMNRYYREKIPNHFCAKVQRVWSNFLAEPIPNNLWCFADSRRGNRNLTFAINWLGADAIKLSAWLLSSGTRDFRDIAKRIKPGQYESYVRFRTLCELLSCPSFDLFITPSEQNIIKYSFPGFLTVSLSGTVPGAFSVRGVSLDRLVEVDQVVKCSDLMMWMPPNPDDFFAVPVGLLLRIMLHALTGMFVAVLDQTKEEDAIACRRPYVKIDVRKSLLESANQIKFRERVPTKTYMHLISMLIRSTYDDEAEAAKMVPFQLFDEKEKTILNNSSTFFALVYGAVKGTTNIARKAVNYINSGDASEAIKNYFNQFQYINDREGWWYKTPDFGPEVATENLKRLLVGTDKAPSGFITKEVQTILEKQRLTQIPEFRQRLEPPGGRALIDIAIEFRQKEFRGKAWDVKDAQALGRLYYGLGRPAEAPVMSERDYLQVKGTDLPQTRELAKKKDEHSRQQLISLLHLKRMNGTPMGPLEKRLAVQYHVLKPAPAEKSLTITESQAFSFPPPAGQQWVSKPKPSEEPSGVPTIPVNDSIWKDLPVEDQARYFDYLNRGLSKSEGHQPGFEEDEACKLSSDPNYVFPAFDVTPEGQVVARCGRSSWMSDSLVDPAILRNLDTKNKLLLTEIAKITKHWCPTVGHQLKLWRWLGVGCLGQNSVDFLAAHALSAAANDMDVSRQRPIAIVSQVSIQDQVKMVEEFKKGALSAKDGKDKCQKRVLFLSRMMTSNILFPYVRDRETALKIAGFDKDKVVLMLHWSRSGWIYATRVSSTSTHIQEREYDVAEVINYFQYPPTTVRLRIFQDFFGGICASNYQFYSEVLRQARRPDCTKSLVQMKRLSVMQPLPLSYQVHMQQLFNRVDQLAPQEVRELQELQNASFLLQCKNLTPKEVDVFHQIMMLENTPVKQMTHAQVSDVASRLYKAKDVDHRMAEADSFANLALCQRPEFVPFIRKKLLAKYPEMKAQEVEKLDRVQLCKLLMNNPNVQDLLMPIYLSQIENAPSQFVDAETGLIKLWDSSMESALNDWLMKQYGTSIHKLREDNKQVSAEEMKESLNAKKAKQSQRQLERSKNVQRIVNFRRYLMGNIGVDACGSLGKFCDDEKFTTTTSQKIDLRNENSVLDLLDIVIQIFCEPDVILLANDLEFVLQVFMVLRRALVMLRVKPSDIPKIEKETSRIALANVNMFKLLRSKIPQSKQCWEQTLPKYIKPDPQSECGQLMTTFFEGDLTKMSHEPSVHKWNRFVNSPFQNKVPEFTVMLLLYEAFANNVIAKPS